MKYLIFTLTLMTTIPFLSKAADNPHYSLQGVWDDRDYNRHLEIRTYRKGIKVKRSGLFRKTKKFRSVGYNAFADNDGNVIELLSDHKLVWKNPRNHSYRVFFKRNRYQRGYNDRFDRNRGNNRYNRGYDNRFNRFSNFDGRWTCNAGRRNIFIESRDGGFRARKYDDDRWYNFTQDPYERDVYRCDNGEKYIWNNGGLTWFSRNGRDRIQFNRRGA